MIETVQGRSARLVVEKIALSGQVRARGDRIEELEDAIRSFLGIWEATGAADPESRTLSLLSAADLAEIVGLYVEKLQRLVEKAE